MVSYYGPLLESDVWHVELCHAIKVILVTLLAISVVL